MNRLKLIVLSSALSLITIGVFAGRNKFITQDVYVDKDGMGNYVKLITTSTFNDLSTNQPSGYSQAQIVSSKLGTTLQLFADDGGNKVPLYTQGNY